MVLAMHPDQVEAARPRFSAAGGKSDRFDAFVLCELARTDSHRFRALALDSDDTRALRALTRAREELVDPARRSATSSARAERFWPGAALVFAELDSPIALAFLERYPSPPTPAGSASGACNVPGPPRLLRTQTPEPMLTGCAPPRPVAPASSRPTLAALSCSAWSPPCARSSADRQLTARSTALRATPRRTDLPVAVPRPQDRHLPRHADRRDRRLPRPLPHHRSHARRRRQSPVAVESANARSPASAAAATNASETPSARSPTAPATGTPGRTRLHHRPRPRPRPPTRNPHPRRRLAARPVALLARPHPYDPAHHGALTRELGAAQVDTGRLMVPLRGREREPASGTRCWKSHRSEGV